MSFNYVPQNILRTSCSLIAPNAFLCPLSGFLFPLLQEATKICATTVNDFPEKELLSRAFFFSNALF